MFMEKNKLDPDIKLDELQLKQIKDTDLTQSNRRITEQDLEAGKEEYNINIRDTFKFNAQEGQINDRRMDV